MSNDLIAFLRARLDEDEATARAVVWDGSGNSLTWRLAASATVEVGDEEFNTDDRTVANHIVNNDPARVLREVEAKRRMLRHYEYAAIALTNAGPTGEVHDLMTGAVNTLRAVLVDHARVYVDHPDFHEDWRPTPS